ncbi:MAG: hypothetical protein WC631_03740 [Candidatus Paceibacterota bacterium]|jgi:hypothetical protein
MAERIKLNVNCYSDVINQGSSLLSERLVEKAKREGRELTQNEIDDQVKDCLVNGFQDDAYHVAKLGASEGVVREMITYFEKNGWQEGADAAREFILKEDTVKE